MTPEIPQIPVEDPMETARSRFRKGRFEWMGGPTVYTQDGLNNQKRSCGYPPSNRYLDPMAEAMGVDSQE